MRDIIYCFNRFFNRLRSAYGPDKTPMKAHQVIAYMDFYNAWIDSYSKSFSGKEEVGK